jgi:peptide-methionine (S)-S-oxide reductase
MQRPAWLTDLVGLMLLLPAVAILLGGLIAMTGTQKPGDRMTGEIDPAAPVPEGYEKATFGSGCFWCTEAVFQELKGVYSAVSGYSGGQTKTPTYREVCSGRTGHAEVIQVIFDPKVISYAELLEAFWQSHDPTTLNRQGNDVGTQYRSVIFYHSDEQRNLAEHYKQELDASVAFRSPIVTQIAPFTEFYAAEAYHQNYFDENPRQPYCSQLIRPKVEKFRKVFKDKLKTSPNAHPERV